MQAQKLSKSDLRPFQFSLRIRHPSIDPAEISREFGVEAEHSYRAGERRPVRSAAASPSVYAESYWLGSVGPVDWPQKILFPDHPQLLQMAVDQLRLTTSDSFGWALSLNTCQFLRLHGELLRRIGSEGGQISMLIALSAADVGSFSLRPEVSRTLGELGITVEFEFTDV
jgi:hypothetical protein